MRVPFRLARRRRARVVLACLALAASLLPGCASKPKPPEAMHADLSDAYPASVSAREYGYVRPAVQVTSRSDKRSRKRASQDGDLWARVRAGMKLGRESNPRIDRMAEAFRRDPAYLANLSQRARPYLHVIVEEIERRGLPAELALMPHVESRWNPAATSPKAAAGLWQFIPSTGRIMGLRQDGWYDGRRDILASTRAALDYLELLHRRLGGEWELAMAAYNCGPGRVESALAANRRSGRPTDFWSLDLPAETEAYVPQILAAARLVADPAGFGLTLPPVPSTPQLELIASDAPLDLTRIAHASGVDLGELKRLNAGLKLGRGAPGGPTHVLVPAGAGRKAASDLGKARVLPALATAVTLTPSRALDLDIAAAALPDLSAPESQPMTVAAAEGLGRARVVKGGETLRSIARAEGLDPAELAAHNGMDASDPLLPGQTLHIPGDGEELAATAVAENPAVLTHRVRRGDSLAAIARRYGVSVADLKRWNGVEDEMPQRGTTLRILRDAGSGAS